MPIRTRSNVILAQLILILTALCTRTAGAQVVLTAPNQSSFYRRPIRFNPVYGYVHQPASYNQQAFSPPATFYYQSPCPCPPGFVPPRQYVPAQPPTDQAAPEGETPRTTPDPDTAPDALGQPTGAAAQAFGGAPSTIAPNMLGDFFGSPSRTSIVQPPDRMGTLRFFPPGGDLGDNQLSVATDGSPLEFKLTGFPSTTVGFQSAVLNADGTVASLRTRQQVGTIPVGGSFQLSTGAPSVQAFLQTSAVAQEGGNGTAALNGGLATLNTEDGVADASSNLNTGDTFFVEQNYTFTPNPVTIFIPGSPGATIGRNKIAEENNPVPRNRLFMNYSAFFGARLIDNGINMHRFSPGFERTFAADQMSFEFRFPFASTLNSTISTDVPGIGVSSVEFGDIHATYKAILAQGPRFIISGGLTTTIPTADDIRYSLANGTPLIVIKNEAVHIMPFVGWAHDVDGRFFHQGFVQTDLNVSGSPVDVNLNNSLVSVGTLYDRDFIFVDVGFGCWLRRTDSALGISGVAPVVELHYNRALENGNFIAAGQSIIGDTTGAFDQLNMVVGLHMIRAGFHSLAFGYSIPLMNRADQGFDHELRIFYSLMMGRNR